MLAIRCHCCSLFSPAILALRQTYIENWIRNICHNVTSILLENMTLVVPGPSSRLAQGAEELVRMLRRNRYCGGIRKQPAEFIYMVLSCVNRLP